MEVGGVEVGVGGGGVFDNAVGNGSNVHEEPMTDDVFRTPVVDIPVETVQTGVGSNYIGEVTPYVEAPRVGMVFKTWLDVEQYYKEYAEQQGFGVSRVAGVKSKCGVRDRIATTWRCECYGAPNMRALREAKKRPKGMEVAGSVGKVWDRVCEDEISRRKRKSKKCECKAMIYAGRSSQGDWDLQHEVYKARRLRMVGGDSTAMMGYFEKMQADNQNFYHAQRLDGLGRLKDVFWVDARSRMAYEEFGDVVCFDATYLTNDYDLPFVNFVGVNHHGQTIFLGCALVSHEDCDTFSWIFKQWLSCMNNRAPKVILTDQATAMRKPLEETMPNTRHRWCIWHIMKKLPEKLWKCERYEDLKKELKSIVYESLNIEEFENRWIAFIEHYKLQHNEWLTYLYAERHMWVPAFMREYFWAGMKTTQRVESINSFFDGFLNRNTKLYEFPEKYSKAMKKRVSDETDADANCSKFLRRVATGYKLEKVFQKLYTDRIFQEVQTECIRMNYCCPREETKMTENVSQYVLEDRVWIVLEGSNEEIITDRKRYYCAMFNKETKEVSCECRKFETNGIMCKHIIRVLDLNHVYDIPSKYILDRWRKDILRKHTLVKVAYHDPAETVEVKRYKKKMTAFEAICDVAAMVDDESVEIVLKGLAELETKITKRRGMKLAQTFGMNYPGEGNATVQTVSDGGASAYVDQNGELTDTQDVAPTPQSTFVDPVPKKRGRGRPKGSRNKTQQEIGYKIPPKKKGRHQVCNSDASDLQPDYMVQVSNKLPVTRSRTSKKKKNSTAATECVGLDHIPEDDILLNSPLGSSTVMSQSL
ncbi:protein FAR1-RELATED SEQUENCE 6-like [Chenopodium quinoa]|uniref:protein FAR1-RELATED SEQUENCE 6-like n=1 Tax=Chenopodium quinoa TaxID=63459 RepID=UPI000B76E8D9|nr:protein FAR1-RELATED SEQUENCE 6-like [Chenopodium quinoa]